MKKGYISRVMAVVICAALMVTSFPASARAEGNDMTDTSDVQTIPGEEETQAVRTESIDWSNRTDDVKIQISRAFYQNNGEEKVLKVSDGRLDLSETSLAQGGKLRLGITYERLRESNEAGEMLQAGDTFGIDFSSAPFICADSENPQSIQDDTGNVLAMWECIDNRLTITITEMVPAVGSSTEFYIDAQIKEDVLQEEIKEAEPVTEAPDGTKEAESIEVFKDDTEKVTTKSIIKAPKEGIKKVVVNVSALKDGYNAASLDTSFDFGMDITIDSAHLGQIANQFAEDPDYPQFDNYEETSEGYIQYQKDIDSFFENHQDVPQLTYTLDIGEGYLLDEEGKTDTLTKYITEDGAFITIDEVTDENKGTIIGTVLFAKTDADKLSAAVTFSNKVYNRTDITLGFRQKLYIDKKGLDDNNKTVSWKGSELLLVPAGGSGGDTEPDNAPYTVDKSGPLKVSDSEISYTLTFLAPSGKTLDGMMLEEVLPKVPAASVSGGQKYLDVKSLTVNDKQLKEGGDGYQIKNGKLQYTFPAGENLTYADVLLVVSMTQEQKDALTTLYSKDPGGFKGWELKDKAHLYDKPDSKTPAASSEEITTTVEPGLLSKSGSQDSMNGERFHWTVDVNTEFIGYSVKGAYLIDYINNKAHRYNEDTGVKVSVDGKSTGKLPLTPLGTVTGDSGRPDKLGTLEAVDKLIKAQAWDVKDGQAYYYDCGNYSVMLIPYGEDYRGKKASFTYDTDLIKTAVDSGEKVTNEVKFVWNYLVGEGPGPGEPASFEVSIDKTGEANPAKGSKTGVGYDEKSQTAKWRFQVNYYPTDKTLKDVQIEETFDAVKQTLLEDSLTYTLWDRSKSQASGKGEIKKGSNGSAYPYYTYDNSSGKCVIFLGDIDTDHYYDIRMNTKVTDGEVLKEQKSDGKIPFANKATLTSEKPEGGRDAADLEGSVPTHTTWIQKDAVGKFNYKEKTFTWKIKVNPNHLKIKNPVVTDILPVNQTFGELTAVESKTPDGKTISGKKNPDGSFAVGKEQDKVDVSASNGAAGTENISIGNVDTVIEDTYILTFTSKVSDEAYQAFLADNQEAGKATFVNKAELSGKYIEPGTSGQEFDVSASDDAENNFTARMVLKDGQYIEKDGKIKWQADVNVEQMNMDGFSVVEDLKKMPFLELDAESVKVYKADINENGTVSCNVTDNIAKDTDFVSCDGEGFRFNIPVTYANDTLRIIFDTYFTDSVLPSEVKNKITIVTPNTEFSSNESNGNMSGDFNIDDYVKIATTPVLKILKISENSVGSGKEEKLTLSGAQFEMKGYKKSGSSYTEESALRRTVTSKANGNAIFVNLTPQVVYEVTETKAPAGYTLVSEPDYYLFVGENGTVPSGDTIKIGGKDVKVSDIVIYKQASGTSAYQTDKGDFPSVELKNNPDAGNVIQFTKTGKDGAALAEGSTAFSLTPEDSGRITKDEWKEQKLDSSGKVSFGSIDAGADKEHSIAYLLKEIKNDNIQYDQGQTFEVKAWMENNVFTYTITPKDVKGGNGNQDINVAKVTGSQDSGYTIQNLYRTGKVTIKKVDAVTDAALYNAAGDYSFAIVDGVNPTEYERASSKSSSGKITFGKVPYSENGYRIIECSTQPGYIMPAGDMVTLDSKEYPVVKTISKQKLDEAATDAAGKEGKKKPAFSIDYSGQTTDLITNERVKGTISFTKKNNNNTVLAGRTFKLWHVAENQGGSHDSYYKTATESTTFKDPATKKDKTSWLIAEAVSDAAGMVSFPAANKLAQPDMPIAWGDYYITETIAGDDLYSPLAGDTAIYISKEKLLESVASPDKTSHDASFACQIQYGDEAGVIKNQLKTASLKLKKTDEIEVEDGRSEKETLKDVTFRITGTDYYGNAVDISEVTDIQGELTFANVPVCLQNPDGSYEPYTLTETRQQGYKIPEVYKVYITPDNAVDTAVNDAKVTVEDSKREIVYDSSKSKETFEIVNEPITGTLKFTKKISSSIDAFNGKFTAGAEFTLKRVVGNSEYVVAENVKSDKDGNVTFKDIEFGNYRLYETKAPDGMQEIDAKSPKKVADISKELMAAGTEFANGATPDSYAYAADVFNTMIEKALEFRKTDEEGIPLEGITFDVYRRGSSVKPDGSDMVMKVPDKTVTYGSYNVLPTVTSDAGTGVFTMTLPYGDYLLVERNTDSAQGDADKTAVWFSVRADKVSVKQNDAMSSEQGKTEINPDSEAWNTLHNTDGKYTVINYMKARFTLKKVEDKDHGYKPVEGAQFRLEYKAASNGTYAPVNGELVTDAKGMIQYSGLKKGFYRLTETANTGYDVSRPFTGEFEVKSSDRRKNIDLTTDRLSPAAGNEDAFVEGKGIVNTRLTGSVTLNKVDGENTDKALDGVTFTLYRQKEAEGIWDKISEFFTGKRYEAAGQEISGSELATKGTLTIEGLEWGSYKLTETSAKAGYKNDGISLSFTVSRYGEKEIFLKTDGHDIYNYQNEVVIRKIDKETKALLPGAVFTVTEKGEDKEIYTGTTGDGTNGTEKGILRIQGELAGGRTYILHEQNPPLGYSLSKDITFVLEQDGTVKIDGEAVEEQMITVENGMNKLRFTKMEKFAESCSDPDLGALSPDELRMLAGAEFTLFTDKECTAEAILSDGQKAAAVSGTDGIVAMDGLVLGENGTGICYYLKETKVPRGYVLDDTVYKAELDAQGKIQIFNADGERLKDDTVINDVLRTDIHLTKVDEKDHDRILPGSVYGLYKEMSAAPVQRAGKMDALQLIATAKTDENGILTFKGVLMDTVYVIRELQEPDGSLISANPIRISFTLGENDEIKISYFDDGSGTAGINPETGEIKWYEPQTQASVAKKDESGSLLAGAALQVEDKEGNVIESWISSDKDVYLIRGVLEAGETYRLVETKAPEGYQIAEPVEFTVDDAPAGPGELRTMHVEMIDKAIKKEIPPSPKDTKGTKTGDLANYTLWLLVLLLSGGAAAGVIRKKKR